MYRPAQLLRKNSPEGRQLYYSVNRSYPYLKPVFALLQGSVRIVPTLKRAVEPAAGIASAWIFGPFAKEEADAASDVDLPIVGRPDPALLSRESASSTCNRWAESSTPSSRDSIWNGKTAPSAYLHKRVDVAYRWICRRKRKQRISLRREKQTRPGEAWCIDRERATGQSEEHEAVRLFRSLWRRSKFE